MYVEGISHLRHILIEVLWPFEGPPINYTFFGQFRVAKMYSNIKFTLVYQIYSL